MVVRILTGIGIGACIGALMGYFGKCSSGACPLTANPYRGAVYGAIMGAAFAVVLAGSLTSGRKENRAEEDRPVNEIKASTASTPAHSDALVHVNNAADFDRYVLNASKPCLADFYSDSCGPCRMLAPTMEKLAETYRGKAVVCKVNLDAAPGLAPPHRIMGIPAVLFFDSGKETHRLIGLRQQADYEDILEKMLEK